MSLISRIKRRARWEWHKHFDRVYRRCVKAPHILSYEECVDYILGHRASVSRMGDGELSVIYGGELGFQRRSAALGEKLKWVMTQDSPTLLLCVPDIFDNLEKYNDVEKGFWEAHNYFNRRKWYKLLIKNKVYGNAFLSRFYAMEFNQVLAAQRVALLKKLWAGRDIIFVEGKDTKMGVGNDLFDGAKSIRRVLCPAKDAFSAYDAILKCIAGQEHRDNDLYILALGPTATALAADLHNMGLQALDMGHMDIEYEWYRMGAKEKVPVTGKFSNEAFILGFAGEAVVGTLNDDEYKRQIIADLSK